MSIEKNAIIRSMAAYDTAETFTICFTINKSSKATPMELLLGSVQFSRSVVSDSLRPHESQRARPPCPSPTPGVHSDSRPSSQWCHPAISSSVIPFPSCPQSLPASESFSLWKSVVIVQNPCGFCMCQTGEWNGDRIWTNIMHPYPLSFFFSVKVFIRSKSDLFSDVISVR